MDPQTTLSEDNLFLLQELRDPQQELANQISLDEFHYFPKPPKELKLMIWRNTVPLPRNICLPDWSYFPEGSPRLQANISSNYLTAQSGESRRDKLTLLAFLDSFR